MTMNVESYPVGDDVMFKCADCYRFHLTAKGAMDCCGGKVKLTGGSSDYYRIDIAKPLAGRPYSAECLDVIMALGMTFAEGEAFKAIWRKAAARLGNGKPGNSALYNAEKVAFMGQAMVRQEGE